MASHQTRRRGVRHRSTPPSQTGGSPAWLPDRLWLAGSHLHFAAPKRAAARASAPSVVRPAATPAMSTTHDGTTPTRHHHTPLDAFCSGGMLNTAIFGDPTTGNASALTAACVCRPRDCAATAANTGSQPDSRTTAAWPQPHLRRTLRMGDACNGCTPNPPMPNRKPAESAGGDGDDDMVPPHQRAAGLSLGARGGKGTGDAAGTLPPFPSTL